MLGGLTAALLALIFWMTGTTQLFGSMIDWVSQHSVLPEYYRQTFYETGEFLPEFAFQLGGGQNAYYFGYYGYLNPIILVSYLFPCVSMVTYLQIASVVMLIASVWLCFLWLRHIRVAFGPAIALPDGAIYTATALFAFATPLLFHSHRQIMFVDYMPFLLLALIGVDRFFARRRGGMLAVSVALLFFTSYLYAVPGISVIVLYGIYRYFSKTDYASWKSFLHEAWRFALCIIAGAAAAAILTIPSMMAIFSGREPGTKKAFEWKYMILGDCDFAGAVCYSGYSMGLTAITYLALCVCAIPVRRKHRVAEDGTEIPSSENGTSSAGEDPAAKDPNRKIRRWHAEIILAIGVLGCAWLPWVRLLLNGFLYDRPKILIPFVPLAVLLVTKLLDRLFAEELSLRRFTILAVGATALGVLSYLFRKDWSLTALFAADAAGAILLVRYSVRKRNLTPLVVPVIVFAIAVNMFYYSKEKPISREYVRVLHDEERDRMMASVLEANEGVYRSAEFIETKLAVNRLHGSRYLSTGFYSSLSNSAYLRMLYKDLDVANPTVNDISYTPQSDILLQTLLGVRFVSAADNAPAGYKPVAGENGANRVYENKDVYAPVFVASKTMSLREYRSLSPADRQMALLTFAVTEEDRPDVYQSLFEDTGVAPDFGLTRDANGNLVLGAATEIREFKVPIPDSLDEYVYVVTMKLAKRNPHRTIVTVNGITEILSGVDNARPNDNFELKFVVSSADPCRELTFQFKGEDVVFSQPQIKRIRFADVRSASDNMTMATELAIPDNNLITGKVAPATDGVLVLTVPFDRYWTIRIDGGEVETKEVDGGFIGCPVTAGTHTFEMEYHAPGRTPGVILSILGVVMLAAIVIVPRIIRRKK